MSNYGQQRPTVKDPYGQPANPYGQPGQPYGQPGRPPQPAYTGQLSSWPESLSGNFAEWTDHDVSDPGVT